MLNEKVTHISLGEGVIVESINNEKIYVKFNNSDENKVFKYPDAFEHFLKFNDSTLQEKADFDVDEKHKKDALKKEEARAEFERKFEQDMKEKMILEKSTRKQTRKRTTTKRHA